MDVLYLVSNPYLVVFKQAARPLELGNTQSSYTLLRDSYEPVTHVLNKRNRITFFFSDSKRSHNPIETNYIETRVSETIYTSEKCPQKTS